MLQLSQHSPHSLDLRTKFNHVFAFRAIFMPRYKNINFIKIGLKLNYSCKISEC